MPYRNNQERQTIQDVFIGGDIILKTTKRIINAKSQFTVHFLDNKSNNSNVNISPKSFYNICSKNEQNPEATIMNLFKFNYFRKENKLPVYDSLISNPYHSKEVYILDSNDLNPDDQYNLLIPSIKKKATKEVNPIILNLLHHNTIAKEYIWIMMLWKLMHAIFLLINTVLLIHLWNLLNRVESKDVAYISIGVMIAMANYFISIVSLFDITTNMPYKAFDYRRNYLLMFAIILCAVELNVIPETIPQNIIDYLDKFTHYRLIYHLLILFIAALLLFNFKMNEFFDEYHDHLPVKHSLIPDQVQYHPSDTGTGGCDYLNNSNNQYTQLI